VGVERLPCRTDVTRTFIRRRCILCGIWDGRGGRRSCGLWRHRHLEVCSSVSGKRPCSQLLISSRQSPHFMEPEGSLPCWQELFAGPVLTTCFQFTPSHLKISYNIILSSTFLAHAAYSAHLVLVSGNLNCIRDVFCSPLPKNLR
jgi:hypothetical protein